MPNVFSSSFKTEACFEQRAQPPVYSTALADLDFLPLRQCRHFLSAVSQELSISNLDDLVLTAKRHRRLAALYPNVADFAHAVERLVDSPSAPPLPAAFLSARPKESENQGVTAASQGQLGEMMLSCAILPWRAVEDFTGPCCY